MPIYIAARDLDGFPIGTHQFIIIEEQSNPHPLATLDGKVIPLRTLGDGKVGYVIGAHSRGNLAVEYFEESDYVATLEYFNKKRVRFYKPDFDTEVVQVKFPNVHDQTAIRKIFKLVEIYRINQLLDKIKYPFSGLGFNSNSWVQTVIELAGGKVPSDLKGFDIAHKKRIPQTYFMAHCPKSRPAIN